MEPNEKQENAELQKLRDENAKLRDENKALKKQRDGGAELSEEQEAAVQEKVKAGLPRDMAIQVVKAQAEEDAKAKKK
jgi:chromosome condensin MukBEF MukE localization factor